MKFRSFQARKIAYRVKFHAEFESELRFASFLVFIPRNHDFPYSVLFNVFLQDDPESNFCSKSMSQGSDRSRKRAYDVKKCPEQHGLVRLL